MNFRQSILIVAAIVFILFFPLAPKINESGFSSVFDVFVEALEELFGGEEDGTLFNATNIVGWTDVVAPTSFVVPNETRKDEISRVQFFLNGQETDMGPEPSFEISSGKNPEGNKATYLTLLNVDAEFSAPQGGNVIEIKATKRDDSKIRIEKSFFKDSLLPEIQTLSSYEFKVIDDGFETDSSKMTAHKVRNGELVNLSFLLNLDKDRSTNEAKFFNVNPELSENLLIRAVDRAGNVSKTISLGPRTAEEILGDLKPSSESKGSYSGPLGSYCPPITPQVTLIIPYPQWFYDSNQRRNTEAKVRAGTRGRLFKDYVYSAFSRLENLIKEKARNLDLSSGLEAIETLEMPFYVDVPMDTPPFTVTLVDGFDKIDMSFGQWPDVQRFISPAINQRGKEKIGLVSVDTFSSPIIPIPNRPNGISFPTSGWAVIFDLNRLKNEVVNTITHEVGHLFGLGHFNDEAGRRNIMTVAPFHTSSDSMTIHQVWTWEARYCSTDPRVKYNPIGRNKNFSFVRYAFNYVFGYLENCPDSFLETSDQCEFEELAVSQFCENPKYYPIRPSVADDEERQICLSKIQGNRKNCVCVSVHPPPPPPPAPPSTYKEQPSPVCGNDRLEDGEQCDGADSTGEECPKYDYPGFNINLCAPTGYIPGLPVIPGGGGFICENCRCNRVCDLPGGGRQKVFSPAQCGNRIRESGEQCEATRWTCDDAEKECDRTTCRCNPKRKPGEPEEPGRPH